LEKKMKKMNLITIIGMLVLLAMACASFGGNNNNTANQETIGNTSENQADQKMPENNDGDSENSGKEDTGGGSLWDTEFGNMLESGDLVVEQIHSNADEETNGRILTVQFTNPSNDDLVITLPCGLVFIPTETDEQELMLIQPQELTLAAGESAPVTPYVVCVELTAPAPAINSGYTIGYLAGDQLLKFAECICEAPLNEELDSMDGVGVQFAAWTISVNGDFTSILEEDIDLGDEFIGLEDDELVQEITEMFSMHGTEWLDRCGIILED
jgi:hypothetical protein